MKHLLTEGAICAAGFWIIGGKRLASNILYHCVLCRKLCGHLQTQKLKLIPSDWMCMDPTFTNIGLDIFGQWVIHVRQTRGGLEHDKGICIVLLGVQARIAETLL